VTIQPLRFGDARTLTLSNLVDENGDPAVFAEGDVLRFTLRTSYSALLAFVELDSEDIGGVTFTVGQSTATIAITSDSWQGQVNRRTLCVWDVELERDDNKTTLDSAELVVLPDVTR
jgi:hypothetical protein